MKQAIRRLRDQFPNSADVLLADMTEALLAMAEKPMEENEKKGKAMYWETLGGPPEHGGF